MLFNIENDAGNVITGYLVPDSAVKAASIRIFGRGQDLFEMVANEVREALVAAGRHSNGQCGFRIDEAILPGLAEISDLEIYDVETGLLIYRRRAPETVLGHKVFRLESHLLPLWRLDNILENKFQFWYRWVDRLGRETATQLMLLNHAVSSYISGKVFYKNYEIYLSQGVKNIAMLRHPYDELAERLLLLKDLGDKAEQLLGERDASIFQPVIAALTDVPVLDETELRRFFKRAPHAVIAILANPLVRQLTAHTPDEMPSPGSLASALETLSTFEVVGLRSDPVAFQRALADSLGLDFADIPSLEEFPRVRELGEQLRAIRPLEAFLEKDLELYHHTEQAFEKVRSA
jgi:hypothetical protein